MNKKSTDGYYLCSQQSYTKNLLIFVLNKQELK